MYARAAPEPSPNEELFVSWLQRDTYHSHRELVRTVRELVSLHKTNQNGSSYLPWMNATRRRTGFGNSSASKHASTPRGAAACAIADSSRVTPTATYTARARWIALPLAETQAMRPAGHGPATTRTAEIASRDHPQRTARAPIRAPSDTRIIRLCRRNGSVSCASAVRSCTVRKP